MLPLNGKSRLNTGGKHMQTINRTIEKIAADINFSGVVLADQNGKEIVSQTYGLRNRAEELENNIQTRFGIASGCKLFTAIAICQLVDKGIIEFTTPLRDCLSHRNFDENITIHHLLTHTSGVADYFDESVMDDFEDLWKEVPMYKMTRLKDFLPLFQHQPQRFTPGESFHYNNAGFILLGLVIEEKTGQSFTDYVQSHIFEPCKMADSGYFTFDRLPKNTATGYIDNSEDGTWRTNIYSLPIRGGSDGGAYITAEDMFKLWDNLINEKLLKKETTKLLFTPHVQVEDDEYYGYGIWIEKKQEEIFKYHVMGYDPGVSFASSFYPSLNLTVVIPSNQSSGPHNILRELEDII